MTHQEATMAEKFMFTLHNSHKKGYMPRAQVVEYIRDKAMLVSDGSDNELRQFSDDSILDVTNERALNANEIAQIATAETNRTLQDLGND